MDALLAYLPEDRAQALAFGTVLPDRAHGAALFADISGFTPLTEALTYVYGPRAGVEALSEQINAVYAALTAVVARHGGSVISFAGDAITCWFDDAYAPAVPRAAAFALALQAAMAPFAVPPLSGGRAVALALKVAVAAGPARRFVAGDPAIQFLDVLAGATLDRVAAGEHMARPGEVMLDAAARAALGSGASLDEERVDKESGASFMLLRALPEPALVTPWAPISLPSEVLRPWVPPVVWERERAGLGAFLTELRPAVALFLRFAGLDFDGDKDAGERLDALVRSAQAIVAETGGALLQLTVGDKGAYLYGAFGAPVAHEDNAGRAARAALALHIAAAELGLPPVQIGVSQGMMRCGGYGPARRTYGVLGDDVNLAARLMARAASGETLLSGRVQAALGEAFTLEPRPPIVLKGKAEPLPVFTLLGLARRRAIRLQEPAYALPMIGRGRELAAIQGYLGGTLVGRGRIVVLEAEAGMGKSRLVAEAVRLARQRGCVGYGGAASASGTQSPYLAWRPVLQALLNLDPEAPPRRKLRHLAAELEDRAPGQQRSLPLLDLLLELELPENDFTRPLAPQERKSAREALLIELLLHAAHEAGADGRALVLVLEDAHWLDPLSHELLRRLAFELAAHPVPLLLLLATRPPDWPGDSTLAALPNTTLLTLGALDEIALEALIRAKLAQLFPMRALGVG